MTLSEQRVRLYDTVDVSRSRTKPSGLGSGTSDQPPKQWRLNQGRFSFLSHLEEAPGGRCGPTTGTQASDSSPARPRNRGPPPHGPTCGAHRGAPSARCPCSHHSCVPGSRRAEGAGRLPLGESFQERHRRFQHIGQDRATKQTLSERRLGHVPSPGTLARHPRPGRMGMGAASSLSVAPDSPPSPRWRKWSRHTGRVTAEVPAGCSAQAPWGLVMCTVP